MINKIKIISNKNIVQKKTYLYSAGFNTDKKLNGKERIHEELGDLKMLVKKKVKIILISHQGSYIMKNTVHFDFLKRYLQKKLRTKIIYIRNKKINFSKDLSKKIKYGEILLLPNVRFYKNEEKNSLKLGKKFSDLADYIIIGGFSKAHRLNASNNSLLNFKPAYLANGIFKEIKKIKPWLNPKKNSICILGGEKKEKITLGLKNFCKIYSYIIPSGVVLNSILKSLKINIGKSKYHGIKEIRIISSIYKKYKKKILLPKFVFVSKGTNFKEIKKIAINNLNNQDNIVGFFLSNNMKEKLKICVKNKSHILLAGTPSLMKNNIKYPTIEIIRYLEKNKKRSLLLGGDTVSDLNFQGNKSSGGGSALYYLSNKSLPLIDTMYKNQKEFNVI
ncbi:phosphoglycerate kinase [Pelagibacterales bacterium SAG-MED09]|nr:phosphoglycerate kinase [Pelagibacterales bacterium SAG-MED09]